MYGKFDNIFDMQFLLSGDARTLTADVWSGVSFTNFKCSIHPTGPILAF